MTDDLGDRMKRYEASYTHRLTPRTPVIIRVDGKAFHTYARNLNKPFDFNLVLAMRYAMYNTAALMSGFKMAYMQSDECSFLITDFDRLETQGWFGYELNKLVSIAASAFAAHFNVAMRAEQGSPIAVFDARAFNIPLDDVANYFLWRHKDWSRNSVQMLARAHFSHSELHGKIHAEIHDMLWGIGVNWSDLGDELKNGIYYNGLGYKSSIQPKYPEIQAYLDTCL